MPNERPNPDELLARVQAEEARSRRGKLKIFFGYVAGVGKTYAMLEAARREKAEGIDVVVGYVEPHGRPDTEALLHGLEALPPRMVPYRGVTLREFDLDAALARRPTLILVDELAHTNAEGLRHAKRWQDVEELLAAGIDVYTTLNVQHIESLNDVIAQITGIAVRETLPDAVLERADGIELIDITPEELMERLQAGKVYVPQQAERALQSFFQKAHLVALRELSLRQAAQRLRRDVDTARQQKAAQAPWATNERLLVCVGPSPTTAKLLRTAKRMAAAFGADWMAVAVEKSAGAPATPAHSQIDQHMRLAEQLGAETHTLVGQNVAETILDYARTRNVTKIIVGKTAQRWWKRVLFGTVVDRLLEKSGDVDVYVIKGEAEALPRAAEPRPRPPFDRLPYAWTTLIIAVCGILGWLSQKLAVSEANIVMVFLLGIAFVGYRFSSGPAIFASVLGVLVFDFFFVPPQLSFAVSDTQYAITFAVMLAIGLIISTLTAQLRGQLAMSQQLERRTSALFRLTRQMTEISGLEFLVRSAGQQLAEIFSGEVVIFVRDQPKSDLTLRYGRETAIARQDVNTIVAQWVADHDQLAGAGTDTLPNATALFAPLIGSQRTLGAVGIRPADPERFQDPEQRRLFETCASLIALSLERDQSVLEAHEAKLHAETEQLRSSLLSSVSHDLRTPLAAIAGASSTLLANALPEKARRELLQSIIDESHRMTRLVENLLDMTRLQAGAVVLNKQWHVLEEIVGSARTRLRHELDQHDVRVALGADFPLISVDGMLLEQVFVNLLENAARYTPPGSRIDISADKRADSVVIRVADNGPGLPQGMETRVFDKFVRGTAGHPVDRRRGVGLGLTICRSILEVHGGKIEARNRPAGGAEFVLTLPCREAPPAIPLDETATTAGTKS
jgi:two-component system sensor histidine kinase KdpD